MAKRLKQYYPTIIPPLYFFTVESTLHRCVAPLLPEHLPFLKKLELGAIITVSPIPFTDSVIAFAENEGISMHSIISENTFPFASSGDAEDWMKIAIELLLALGRDPVLLIGSVDTSIDAAVIACVRRLQKWSMVSIISEFRILTGRRDFDMEQFIECFDVSDAVRISRRRMPAYINIYIEMEEEEMKYLAMEKRINQARDQEAQREVLDRAVMAFDPGEKTAASPMPEKGERTALEDPHTASGRDGDRNVETVADVVSPPSGAQGPYMKLVCADPLLCITSHSQYDPARSEHIDIESPTPNHRNNVSMSQPVQMRW